MFCFKAANYPKDTQGQHVYTFRVVQIDGLHLATGARPVRHKRHCWTLLPVSPGTLIPPHVLMVHGDEIGPEQQLRNHPGESPATVLGL